MNATSPARAVLYAGLTAFFTGRSIGYAADLHGMRLWSAGMAGIGLVGTALWIATAIRNATRR